MNTFIIYSSSSKKINKNKIFEQSSIPNNDNSLKKLDNSRELVETRKEFRILKFQLEQYIERNYSVFDGLLSNIIETDLTKLKKVLPTVLLDSDIDKMDLGSKKNEVMNIVKSKIYSPNNSNFLKFLQNRERKEQQITRIQSPNRTNFTSYETPTPGNSTQNFFNQRDSSKFQFKIGEAQQILEKKEKNDITQVLGKKLLSLSKSSLNSPQELQKKTQELDSLFQNISSIDHKVKNLSESDMDNMANESNFRETQNFHNVKNFKNIEDEIVSDNSFGQLETVETINNTEVKNEIQDRKFLEDSSASPIATMKLDKLIMLSDKFDKILKNFENKTMRINTINPQVKKEDLTNFYEKITTEEIEFTLNNLTFSPKIFTNSKLGNSNPINRTSSKEDSSKQGFSNLANTPGQISIIREKLKNSRLRNSYSNYINIYKTQIKILSKLQRKDITIDLQNKFSTLNNINQNVYEINNYKYKNN